MKNILKNSQEKKRSKRTQTALPHSLPLDPSATIRPLSPLLKHPARASGSLSSAAGFDLDGWKSSLSGSGWHYLPQSWSREKPSHVFWHAPPRVNCSRRPHAPVPGHRAALRRC